MSNDFASLVGLAVTASAGVFLEIVGYFTGTGTDERKHYKLTKDDENLWHERRVLVSEHYSLRKVALWECSNHDNKYMAVKEIPKFYNNEDQKDTFLSEIKILKSLIHENIVRYLGSYIFNDFHCICMEYVTGGTLSDHLLNRHLPEEETKDYTKQILEGLVYLHQKRIVHRNLQPRNILLQNANNETFLKICGFGSAISMDNRSTNSPIRDTVDSRYMAPEILKEPSCGTKADIFSLGCIMMEMLSGNPPERQQRQPEWKTFKNISGECHQFITECILFDQKYRKSASELKQHAFIV